MRRRKRAATAPPGASAALPVAHTRCISLIAGEIRELIAREFQDPRGTS